MCSVFVIAKSQSNYCLLYSPCECECVLCLLLQNQSQIIVCYTAAVRPLTIDCITFSQMFLRTKNRWIGTQE